MNGRVTVAGARYFQQLMIGNGVAPYPTFYAALVRQTRPTVFNTAAELDEVDTDDYARAEIANDVEHWIDASTTARTNAFDIAFSPAEVDWGTIKHWALCTEPLEGDVLVFGSFAAGRDVYALDRAIIPARTISLALNVLYQGD